MKDALLKFHDKFETFVVCTLLGLLMFVLAIATGLFTYIMLSNLVERIRQINELDLMQARLHIIFAGFLVLLLGLELMETVKMYLTDHVIHVEVVFLVAMIAVGRHVIEIDYRHANPVSLFGTAAIVVGLAFGYFLLKKSHPLPSTRPSKPAEG